MIRHFALPLALLTASPALHAQTGGSLQQLGGTPVPGVCLVSLEEVFATSALGKATVGRVQELTQLAQAEVDVHRGPLEAEAKALQAKPDSADTKAKRDDLTKRWQTVQRQAEHSSREIEATRTKAMERVAAEARPVIAQVYTARKCGLLLDRSVALGGNLANDLTPDVVLALDAKIKSFSFERAILPPTPMELR